MLFQNCDLHTFEAVSCVAMQQRIGGAQALRHLAGPIVTANHDDTLVGPDFAGPYGR
jgi:hypothetical protein